MNYNCKPRRRDRVITPVTTDCALWQGSTGYVSSESVITNDGSEAMDDVVCKDFKKRLQRGEVINNPCTYTKTVTEEQISGSVYHSKDGGWFEWRGPVTGRYMQNHAEWVPADQVADLSVDSEYHKRTAKLSALGNIQASPYAFGEDVAELKKTVRYLRNPITGLLNVGSAFRKSVKERLRNGSARTLAEAHASAWLQYRFALMPFLRSSHDLTEALVTGDLHYPERQTAHGYSSQGVGSSDTVVYGTTNTETYSVRKALTEHHHSSILYEVTNPVRDWQRKYGLGVRDIPYVAWQIMPYSFVVDRAVNISAAIEGITNFLDPSVRVLSAAHRVSTESEITTTLTGRALPPWTVTVTGTDRVEKDFSYNRVQWLPSVGDLVPPVNLGGLVDDTVKVVDSLALFLNLIRK